jgi:hypothetical protein
VLAEERAGIAPSRLALIDRYQIDPHPVTFERLGMYEHAFIVARAAGHVVFFDDVEGDFGTAREVAGRLTDCAMFGNLALTIGELHRLAAD